MIDLDAIRGTVANLQTIVRAQQFVHEQQLCDLLAYVDALREAAGRVICYACETDLDIPGPAACDHCDPLRALLNPPDTPQSAPAPERCTTRPE